MMTGLYSCSLALVCWPTMMTMVTMVKCIGESLLSTPKVSESYKGLVTHTDHEFKFLLTRLISSAIMMIWKLTGPPTGPLYFHPTVEVSLTQFLPNIYPSNTKPLSSSLLTKPLFSSPLKYWQTSKPAEMEPSELMSIHRHPLPLFPLECKPLLSFPLHTHALCTRSR